MLWMAEILTMVAIAITGVQDADVHCIQGVNAWDEVSQQFTNTPGAEVDGFAFFLGPDVWVKGRFCKKLATLDRRATTSATRALFVFTHELAHIDGHFAEKPADCYAVHAAKRVAKLLNARNPHAARRAVKRWARIYWHRKCPGDFFKRSKWIPEPPRPESLPVIEIPRYDREPVPGG